MKAPLVTVIIPTYNRAVYLKGAIDSVLKQTYDHFELLILDNCSTDGTLEVINGYPDQRIKYIRHQSNIRVIGNWSYGIYSAKGEYLSVLCDDDTLDPNFLSIRVAQFIDHQDVVSVFSSLNYFRDNEQKNIKSERNAVYPKTLQGLSALKIVLDKQIAIGSMYRTTAIQNIWDKSLIGGKTLDVMCGALLVKDPGNKVVYLGDLADYNYQLHENQDSSENAFEVANDGARMYNVLMDQSNRKESHLVKAKLVEHWNRNGRQFWNRQQIEFAKKCFLRELEIQLSFTTFGRLLRCYLAGYRKK